MDTNTEQIKHQQEIKKEWVEPERKKPKNTDTLPPSSDAEFWGEDAAVHIIPTDEKGRPIQGRIASSHYFIQRGQAIVCTGCPYEHTVSVDTKKFTARDGQIISIDKV